MSLSRRNWLVAQAFSSWAQGRKEHRITAYQDLFPPPRREKKKEIQKAKTTAEE
jgi:hypothetical protein